MLFDCCSAARKLISHEMWCREAQEWRAKYNTTKKIKILNTFARLFLFSSISARLFYCSVYKLLLTRMRRSEKLINNEQVMRSSLSSLFMMQTGCSRKKINLIFFFIKKHALWGDTKIDLKINFTQLSWGINWRRKLMIKPGVHRLKWH